MHYAIDKFDEQWYFIENCTVQQMGGGKNMVDTLRIKKRIEELGISQAEIAKRLNCAQSTISLKINNKRPFFLDEAWELAKILEIEDQFYNYFFSSKIA